MSTTTNLQLIWRLWCCTLLLSGTLVSANRSTPPLNPSFPGPQLNGRSMALALFHRDSPTSPFHRPQATLREKAHSAMRRSVHRSRSLQEAMKPAVGSSISGAVLSPGQASAEYMVRMQLGTPPQELLLTIDTGSGMLWTQCKQCRPCFPSQEEPLYDPAKSSTYAAVPCADSVCDGGTDPGLEIFNQGCSGRSRQACLYRYSYGDTSSSAGNLGRDTLSVRSGFGSASRVPGIVFGCALNNQGLFQQESGILGLGRSALSLPWQLAKSSVSFTKFRYCFTDRIKQENATSFLSFGDLRHDPHKLLDEFDSDTSKMLYTPLLRDSTAPLFYFVELTGISVARRRLPIRPSLLQRRFNPDGSFAGGGTVIDSGTTFTNLVDPVYRSLLSAFAAAAAHLPRNRPREDIAFDLCYNTSREELDSAAVPSVSFFFRSDKHKMLEIEVALSAHHVLVPADDHVLCLAFFSAGDALATSFFGNYQQENCLIEYDLPKNRLGFKHAACAFNGDQ